MNGIPCIPDDAPFSAEQRHWLNGYLAGLFSRSDAPPAREETPARGPLLFLYGSQTGSSEGLARDFASRARKRGFQSRALGMEEHGAIDFAAEKRVCIVTSTYGDGDMPDNAQNFWDALQQNGSSPKLSHLEYAVLALGDTNYVQFCEAGKRFDQRFEELGAKRVQPRADCDVDYEEAAEAWFGGLMDALGGAAPADNAAAPEPNPPAYGKKNPFPATLKTNRRLNGPDSAKDTRHIEIQLEGSGLTYEVGDALGVIPTNCPDFVQEILAATGLSGDETVSGKFGEAPLRAALTERLDLSRYLEELPPPGIGAQDLAASLRPLKPRLYSIASSPKANSGEVHLTVGVVRYELNGRPRKGVCSTFLADRVGEGGRLPVFVQSSHGFRLPPDPATSVIMVGPGTGVAPFIAFLQERRAVGASGRNWLFFGDQREACDFLYREELADMKTSGVLTRLDTAFSRDQPEKIYVQNRMAENAAEIWTWLREGAFFYVCGDAKRMAKDVDAALHEIAATAGGLGSERAADYVKELKAEKRYLRDVY